METRVFPPNYTVSLFEVPVNEWHLSVVGHFLLFCNRGAWSLDSALRTTPELITEEPFPKLDFDIDLESPGKSIDINLGCILC